MENIVLGRSLPWIYRIGFKGVRKLPPLGVESVKDDMLAYILKLFDEFLEGYGNPDR